VQDASFASPKEKKKKKRKGENHLGITYYCGEKWGEGEVHISFMQRRSADSEKSAGHHVLRQRREKKREEKKKRGRWSGNVSVFWQKTDTENNGSFTFATALASGRRRREEQCAVSNGEERQKRSGKRKKEKGYTLYDVSDEENNGPNWTDISGGERGRRSAGVSLLTSGRRGKGKKRKEEEEKGCH